MKTAGKFLFAGLALLLAGAQTFTAEMSLDEYRAKRAEALSKRRRVIYNNDGCDAYLYPKNREFSLENFLSLRTSPLVGTHVDTIFYCTLSSGFGQFTHNTKVGEFLTKDIGRKGKINSIPEFVKQGTDPLRVVAEFADKNGMEIFWSNRINDTHDAAHRPNNPFSRWAKLKQEHPEYLSGKCAERLPYGRWSAVNFGRKEVRDLCVSYYTEVCENYPVDGIELDFFRHLFLFKNVAMGKYASAEELQAFTEMVKRIRQMTERVGSKKGKPILVAVRVPDSVEYCKGCGIDLEEWLRQGLVDIVTGSGYFRLNDWDRLASLGKKYGVQVYAGLSEPRVRDENSMLRRKSILAYRARALEALSAGVNGVYLFNQFSVSSRSMRYIDEVGSEKLLRNTNRLHFVTYRDGNPENYLRNGARYQNIPQLTPGRPVTLKDKEYLTSFTLGALPDKDYVAKLLLWTQNCNKNNVEIKLNGTRIDPGTITGDGIMSVKISSDLLRPGKNILGFKKVSATEGEKNKTCIMSGDTLLKGGQQGQWRRLFSGKPCVEEVAPGGYRLGDMSDTDNGIYNLVYPLNTTPSSLTTIDFAMRLESSTAPDAVCMRVSNGKHIEYITFEEDRISFRFSHKSVKASPTASFNKYRVMFKDNSIALLQNGKKILNGQMNASAESDSAVFEMASFRTPYMQKNSLLIGSLSEKGKGVAIWKDIYITSDVSRIKDVALLVLNDPSEPEVLPFVTLDAKPIAEEYPNILQDIGEWNLEYNPETGLPSAPWKLDHYTNDTAQVEDDILVLNNNGIGKSEYATVKTGLDKFSGKRFLRCDFSVQLLEKTEKPQFTVTLSLPSGKAQRVWNFSFSVNEIITRAGSKSLSANWRPENELRNYVLLVDRNNGTAELYGRGESKPILTSPGRTADNYPNVLRFGDGSGSVKGKVKVGSMRVKSLSINDFNE